MSVGGVWAARCERDDAAYVAFDPEDVRRMTTAYEDALVALGLSDCEHPSKETLARAIIEIMRTGEKEPRTITALALARIRGTTSGDDEIAA